MSDIPPLNPSRWPARVAWLVIISLVMFGVYRNARARRADANDINVDDIRIRVTGEELVGFKMVGAKVGPAQAAPLNESQDLMVRQLDEAARSQDDKLHVAIIAGEVLGREQALARLDALGGEPKLADDIAALRKIYSSNGTALDATEQSRLVQRHDYFARVALSYGVAATAEPRKSIEAQALHSTVVLGAVGFAVALLVLGAIGFFVAGLVLKTKGRIQRSYIPDPSANTAYLEGFAIYFTLFLLGFGLIRRYFKLENMQWEWLALLIIPVVMFWIAKRGGTVEEERNALGWHSGKGVLREVGAGVAGYLAGIVVMIAGFLLTLALMKWTGIQPEHPLIHMLEGNRWHVLGLYALVSVFAPVMEETMFRGALFHHLRRRWGWAISAPIVSFIFAIIHPQGWVAVPVLGSIALVLAALREWRGSLIAPMVAHACNNFVVLTFALAVLR